MKNEIFTWGQSGMGAFQQDFMSASDYENPKCDKPYYDPYCEHYEHEGHYTNCRLDRHHHKCIHFQLVKIHLMNGRNGLNHGIMEILVNFIHLIITCGLRSINGWIQRRNVD